MSIFSRGPKASPTEPAAPASTKPLQCNFCAKSQREVRKLIAGPEVFICDECIGLCNNIIDEELRKEAAGAPTAAELAERLEARVIGQVAARRSVTSVLLQHIFRAHHEESALKVPHVLLLGPRGCGKTTLGRALCEVTGMPAHHSHASRLSESGYVGDDVENMLGSLVEAAGGAGQVQAERGILFIDGAEKLRAHRALGAWRDISGEGVQRDLLRILDGVPAEVSLNHRRHPQTPLVRFETSRVLVVAAVTVPDEHLPMLATPRGAREVLREMKILDELVARFGLIVVMDRLDVNALACIFDGPKGLVSEAQKMLGPLGAKLSFDAAAVDVVARAAAADGEGAWMLARVLAKVMDHVLAGHSGERAWRIDEEKARLLVA